MLEATDRDRIAITEGDETVVCSGCLWLTYHAIGYVALDAVVDEDDLDEAVKAIRNAALDIALAAFRRRNNFDG